VADTSLPGLAFVIAYTVGGNELEPAITAALLVAVGLTVVRLARRETLQYAFAGLIGVGIAAFIASRTGRAEDFFLPGLLLNAGYALAYAVSIWARWPLIGVIAGPLVGEGMEWRKDPRRVSVYTKASWIWVGVFLVRLAVQLPLYLAGAVVALGIAKAAMGVPIFVVGVWLTFLVLRQGGEIGHGSAGAPAFRSGSPGRAEGAPAEDRDPPRGRLATAHERQPPGFLIIGAKRAGTTSLYRYLTEHPEIGSAWRKEVHYFDRYFDRGRDWYLAHFPRRGKFAVVGEASPFYMVDPRVPGRVGDTLENVRFIVLLRNPVDRAYSDYRMRVRHGREQLSFEDAIASEDERLALSDDPASPIWQRFSYVRRGLYAEQLERWFELFPRERFAVIRSEDFYEAPGDALREAQGFLGVEPHLPAAFKPYHQTEYSDMDPATRERLRERFAPHNRRLYSLLGRDFGWDG